MRKIRFVLILFLIILLFFFKTTKKNILYIYAQSNPGISPAPPPNLGVSPTTSIFPLPTISITTLSPILNPTSSPPTLAPIAAPPPATPTPTPTCKLQILTTSNTSFDIYFGINQKICYQNIIYKCIESNGNFKSEILINCNENNKYCNQPGIIYNLDDSSLNCTDNPPPQTSIGSLRDGVEDVYGITCGIPRELNNSTNNNYNYSKCCYPKASNTQDKIKESTENLGCLIDTQFLGSPIKLICFSDLVDGILGALGINNIVSSIQENSLLRENYETRSCVAGLPLIPAGQQATSLPSASITPRPTIMLNNNAYVIAKGEELSNQNCQCRTIPNSLNQLCEKYIYGREDSYEECSSCSAQNKIYTSLGCIPLNIKAFIQETLFPLLLGIAGFIALLCIVYSAFQIQTSSGNVEKVKKAQELLTSCIMGLMLIIFSVFILRLIGINILRIPGLI